MATLDDVKNQINVYIKDYDLYGRVIENVYRSSSLSVILRKNSRTVTGGIDYEFRARLSKSDIPVQRARYYDELVPTRVGNPVMGKVRLGILQQVISISKDEIDAVRGEAEVIDLVTDKLNELELSFKEAYTRDLIFGSGTNNEPSGLLTILTAGNNWAGIDETTYPLWSPINIDGSTYTVFGESVDSDSQLIKEVTGSSGVRVFDALISDVIEKLKYDNDDSYKPNYIVMTEHLYSVFKLSVFPQAFITDKELVDIGFDNVKYNGITIITDPFLPDKTILFLNTDYIEFVLKKGKDMNITDFEPVSKLQRVLVAIAEMEFSLVCTSRRRQAKLVNIGS